MDSLAPLAALLDAFCGRFATNFRVCVRSTFGNFPWPPSQSCSRVPVASLIYDVAQLNNGILSGLVAISASGPLIQPEGAFIVGIFASAFYLLGVEGLRR